MNINDIIIAPVMTEKSSQAKERGVYTFEVHLGANKVEISKAVHQIFKVDVEKCNVLVRKPKYKILRTHRGVGRSRFSKIATVTLKKDQKIADLEV